MARHGRAGGDGSLPSEREVPWLSKLGRACDALPARTIRVNTRRDRYNVGIAVQQLGSPTDAPVLIFLHGVLADKGTWRYVAGALGKDHEIWLIDRKSVV